METKYSNGIKIYIYRCIKLQNVYGKRNHLKTELVNSKKSAYKVVKISEAEDNEFGFGTNNEKKSNVIGFHLRRRKDYVEQDICVYSFEY